MSASKSAEAFRTISEASKELGVPQHVLRHWEDVFGQIRPMRRAGGRRYYRPVDLDLLRGVRVLLYDERYTTKGVQKIFRESGAKYISEIGRQNIGGSIDDKAVQGDVSRLKALEGQENKSNQNSFNQSPKTQQVNQNGVHQKENHHDDPLRTPQGRAHLAQLIAKLEMIQEALDDTVLAIEAISNNTQQEPGADLDQVPERKKTGKTAMVKPEIESDKDS